MFVLGSSFSLYILYVCVGWREMSWRQCPKGQTHSKASQSSALNSRVRSLHLACRQQSVSAFSLADSTSGSQQENNMFLRNLYLLKNLLQHCQLEWSSNCPDYWVVKLILWQIQHKTTCMTCKVPLWLRHSPLCLSFLVLWSIVRYLCWVSFCFILYKFLFDHQILDKVT